MKGKTTHIHGQRRCGHEQIHDAVAHGGANDRYQKHPLAKNLPHAASLGVTGLFGSLWGKLNALHRKDPQQGHDRQNEIDPHVRNLQHVFGPVGNVGPQDGPQNSTRQYPGDGFFFEGHWREFGSRKPIELGVGAVKTRDHGACNQAPKALQVNSARTHEACEQAHQESELKGSFAPIKRLHFGHE